MSWLGRGVVCAMIVGVLAVPSAAFAQQPGITLQASATQLRSGSPVALSGQVSEASAGAQVTLSQAPYPYTAYSQVMSTTPDASGNFSFTVSPDLDTRYLVQLQGTDAQASVQIAVTDRIVVRVRALPLGRAGIRILVYHPAELRWGKQKVQWSFAHGGRFHTGPATRTRAVSPTLISLSTTVALPPGHFHWRACFHAGDDQALVNLQRPPGCTGRGYQGGGQLPFGYPSAAAIRRAEAYLNSRGGHTALAVVTTEGREYGIRLHDHFITGSVVKAMLLVAYLRRLHAMGRHTVDSASNAILYPMIHVSDNNAASRCGAIVGNSGLYSVAHAAGMVDFSVTTDWGSAILSAYDQAKFFFEMDSLIPKEFVGYARNLLSGIAGFESWGIPAVARPLGYHVFFKGGWRPSPDIYLVHQVARLEGHGRKFAMAIMTDGDAGMGDGISKIEGTTRTLL